MFRNKKALKSAFFLFPPGTGWARKSLWLARIFCGLLLAAARVDAAAPEPLCRLPGVPELVTIAAVSDGDTVRLQDGRRVRLLAFGALELDRDHPERSTALALEAKKKLQWLLPKHSQVSLLTDHEKYDVHGRTLAQLIRADGLDVGQTQLEQGLAHVYIFPPNDSLWRCYQRYEATARTAKRGIWALPEFQVQPVASLRAGAAAYHLLQGRVTAYHKRGGAITVELDRRVLVHVRAENAPRFAGQWQLPAIGESLAVRGMLNWRDGKAHLDLRHPQALDVVLSR
ncbi:thermonuclease family protein [Permianibacter sp. IMCC34836]|uniref:thermonuclease family protein n=1 Tax=Permianibacter fluminis TaxID=2738515 RepID=UPI001552B655|nr:thermonuclease family protein [Permianibacter fluminis]NQD36288.1 thermonuclease family protein [Permianibacter fluminis]